MQLWCSTGLGDIEQTQHGAIIRAIIRQSCPWPQGTRGLNEIRSRWVGEVCAAVCVYVCVCVCVPDFGKRADRFP